MLEAKQSTENQLLSCSGPRPENTLEALRDLIRRDKEGPLNDLHYIEFDVHVRSLTCICGANKRAGKATYMQPPSACNCVQETKDGELVVLHDLRSVLAASADAERNATAVKDLLDSGLDLQHTKVEV